MTATSSMWEAFSLFLVKIDEFLLFLQKFLS